LAGPVCLWCLDFPRRWYPLYFVPMCVLVPGFFFLFCVFISQIAIFCSSFSPFCYLWQLQQRDAASCHGCSRVVVIGQGRGCSNRYRNCAECSLSESNWRTSGVEADAEGYGESSGRHRKKDRAQGDAYLRGEERDLSAVNILCCFSGGCVNGSGAGFYFEVPTLVGAFHSLPDCFGHDLCRRLPEAGNLPSSEGRLRKREIQFLGKRPQLFLSSVLCLKVCCMYQRCRKHDSGFLVFKLLVNGLNFSFVSIVWKLVLNFLYERCKMHSVLLYCLSL